ARDVGDVDGVVADDRPLEVALIDGVSGQGVFGGVVIHGAWGYDSPTRPEFR
ncbi:MAG: hypothetical protein JNK04_19700, partial [Myxococcales bacterium]|nr:hypothetical protein [Myxococcales bacterium]